MRSSRDSVCSWVSRSVFCTFRAWNFVFDGFLMMKLNRGYVISFIITFKLSALGLLCFCLDFLFLFYFFILFYFFLFGFIFFSTGLTDTWLEILNGFCLFRGRILNRNKFSEKVHGRWRWRIYPGTWEGFVWRPRNISSLIELFCSSAVRFLILIL